MVLLWLLLDHGAVVVVVFVYVGFVVVAVFAVIFCENVGEYFLKTVFKMFFILF
jgi:hypothetical protein